VVLQEKIHREKLSEEFDHYMRPLAPTVQPIANQAEFLADYWDMRLVHYLKQRPGENFRVWQAINAIAKFDRPRNRAASRAIELYILGRLSALGKSP